MKAIKYGIIVLAINLIACSSVPNENATILKKSTSFYVGTGGKGIRLAVLEPEYKGINSKDTWVPLFIQGSYIKNCTLEDIKKAIILNEATAQLIHQLGVELSPKGESTLLAARISTTNAETALAKGIVAQQNGTVVATMSYYYVAQNYNP